MKKHNPKTYMVAGQMVSEMSRGELEQKLMQACELLLDTSEKSQRVINKISDWCNYED